MVHLVEKDVGQVGYGLMGFTWRPNPTDTATAVEVIHEAINSSNIRFLNGGEFYGPPERNSLQLLNAYFTKYPQHADQVIISIKGGADPTTMAPTGDEKGIRRSVDQCLKVLDGKKKLDLFECARVDPNVPIEESIRVLAEYVKEGKLGGISLSEVSAKTIRRAASVHAIAAVEVEFSLCATDILDNGVAETCAELGIPIVAYSPLGRGFFTGSVHKREDLPEPLRDFPRYTPGNFEKNMELVDEVRKVAEKKGVAMTQIALAWIKYQSGRKGMPEIIAIPGSTTAARNEENFKEVTITDAEFEEINEVLKRSTVVGARYPEHVEKYSFA